MKNPVVAKYLFLLVIIASIASCKVTVHHKHKHKHMPPGHAKKISGSKSAKPHAPGQKKKG